MAESRVFALSECEFTVQEAAEHLRVSRSLLYELIKEGKINPVKLGKRTLVPGAEIQRFMRSLERTT